MGFSIRIAPGVRVRASSRGVRTSLGPRIARVHVGSGRPGISTGVGPVGYYTGLGPARNRRSTTARAPSASQQLAAARAAEKADQAQELADAIQRILRVHHADFDAAEPPIATPPPAVALGPLRARHRREARRATGFFDRTARKQALAEADRRAQLDADGLATRFEAARVAWQEELDSQWAALLANDPAMTLGTLATAFEDNEAAAAPVGIAGSEVSLAVIVPGQSAVPDRRPTRTAAGNLSLKKLTKTESAGLYTQLVAGHLLVTVKEAFAVAPGVTSARIVAVRPGEAGANGRPDPEALIAASIERSQLIRVSWRDMEARQILGQVSTDLILNEKGVTRALTPIRIEREPGLRDLLDAVDFEDLF